MAPTATSFQELDGIHVTIEVEQLLLSQADRQWELHKLVFRQHQRVCVQLHTRNPDELCGIAISEWSGYSLNDLRPGGVTQPVLDRQKIFKTEAPNVHSCF